jgi:hypothetical protein
LNSFKKRSPHCSGSTDNLRRAAQQAVDAVGRTPWRLSPPPSRPW